MHLFAFDNKEQLTSASKAKKGENYFCRECKGPVRLRGGVARQRHFFHLKPDIFCAASQKSLNHLHVQYYLAGIIPEGQCALERRFPEINRIADVYWEQKQLVFEVQCSPISKEEVKERNSDYQKLGLQVIWIFHDHRFNKWRVSAAEQFLQGNSPYYFTNMDKSGKGEIYDQIDVIKRGRRMIIKKIGFVKLNEPKAIDFCYSNILEKAPNFLKMRLENWPLHFTGDLIDQLEVFEESLKKALNAENSVFKTTTNPLIFALVTILEKCILRPYKLFFQMILEKSCF